MENHEPLPFIVDDILIHFDEIPWAPHPTIPGVETRLHMHEESFAPTDALLARLEPGRKIPWHVHETDTEIVYILQGRALLLCAEYEGAEEVKQYEMQTGRSVIIPPLLMPSA